MVLPMKAELTENGFTNLNTAEEVSALLAKEEGSTLVVVNSVCGCAARNARPSAVMASQNEKKPDNLVTVFAGFDSDAVNKAREFFQPYPPSSPSMALFKDGELVHFLERHHIEGNTAEAISANLVAAFNEFC